MSISDIKLYGVMSVNGQEQQSLGRAEFPDLIKRLIIWSRETESRGFSSVTIRLSVSELKMLKPEDDSNNPYAGIDMSLVEMATPEEEEEIARVLARNNSPHRNNWTRGAHSESYRNSLTPDEWYAAREEAKRLWPDEYEKWRHLFNG